MSTSIQRVAIVALAAVAALQLASGTAQAQYYPGGPAYGGPPGGYYPPGYGGYYPQPGGYWNGQAAALDAYGNLGVSQEQARILREQANQAKLDTKKKTIDAMAYERAHKYWYADEQIDIGVKKIERALNTPTQTELINGKALNTLLPYLDKMIAGSRGGPSVFVEPQVVKSLNVTSGVDNGNVGLLKDVNHLDWPTALEGPSQKELDRLLREATDMAVQGPVPNGTLKKLRQTADKLEDETRKKFQKSDIDGGEYLEGKRYLTRVRDAIAALQQPNVGQYLTGSFGPRGDTVDEIVESMTSKGLTFAPAQPGQEFAYIALHRAFVNFANGMGTPDTGFRVLTK